MKLRTQLYGHYEESGHVFKSCGPYIVVMKKLKDTVTNEDRASVVDPLNAKFRGTHFMVVLIFDKMEPKYTVKQTENTIHLRDKLKYIVGEVVYANDYDHDSSKICAPGIHYFKSLEAAFYYNLGIFCNITYQCPLYDDDGAMISETRVRHSLY
jgi:hypothetical protein